MVGQRTKHTILMIEDNRADAYLVQQLLAEIPEFEAEFIHATSLAYAVTLLESVEPDVILLDLGLPDSQGLAGLEALSEAEVELPVIVLTANVDEETSLKALDRGAQDYLIKDAINAQSLSLAIRYAQERHHYTQQLLDSAREQYALVLQVEGERFFRELVANIHHEFRTPLTMIQNSISLIQRRPVPEVIDKYTGHISEALKRLLQIGNYMATVSRLSMAHDNAPKTSSCVLEQCCAELAREEPRVHHKISHAFDMAIDEDDVVDILTALVNNALGFSDDDSPIIIEATALNDHVEIMVVDFGIGIQNDEFEKIFQPFYKVDNSRLRVRNCGAGLGLSVVQAAAFAYGGTVKVASDFGVGSTFTVQLPLA